MPSRRSSSDVATAILAEQKQHDSSSSRRSSSNVATAILVAGAEEKQGKARRRRKSSNVATAILAAAEEKQQQQQQHGQQSLLARKASDGRSIRSALQRRKTSSVAVALEIDKLRSELKQLRSARHGVRKRLAKLKEDPDAEVKLLAEQEATLSNLEDEIASVQVEVSSS